MTRTEREKLWQAQFTKRHAKIKASVTRYINACPDSPYIGDAIRFRRKIDDVRWYKTHGNLIDAAYPYQYGVLLILGY